MLPKPIGYIEVQRSWIGSSDGFEDTLVRLLHEADVEMALSSPTHRRHGSRVEAVTDGAGVQHYNLYVSYEPKIQTTEPLNPHNLNEAPVTSMGVGDLAIGMKEQRF